MEIVPAILDLVDNLNSPTVNKNKKGKRRSGIGYNKQFPLNSHRSKLTAAAVSNSVSLNVMEIVPAKYSIWKKKSC